MDREDMLDLGLTEEQVAEVEAGVLGRPSAYESTHQARARLVRELLSAPAKARERAPAKERATRRRETVHDDQMVIRMAGSLKAGIAKWAKRESDDPTAWARGVLRQAVQAREAQESLRSAGGRQ